MQTPQGFLHSLMGIVWLDGEQYEALNVKIIACNKSQKVFNTAPVYQHQANMCKK